VHHVLHLLIVDLLSNYMRFLDSLFIASPMNSELAR